MNILITGMLWSGSSAVLDMLKEYESIGIIPGEFDEFRRPGMIADHIEGRVNKYYPCSLTNHINKQERFKNLIKRAIKFDVCFFKRLAAIKNFQRNVTDNCSENLSLGKKWFEDLKEIYSKDKAYTAIDQPILLGQHFDIWPQVLDPFKMIIVYRDPRDQLAQIIKQNHLFLHMRSPDADIYGGDRLGAIKYQIHTLQARNEWVDRIKKKHGKDKVLIFSFEEFIKNNSKLRIIIERWLGLNPESKFRKILYPEVSINNIGIYRDILSSSEVSLLDNLYADYLNREKSSELY